MNRWNSVIFKTLQSNAYRVLLVSQDFLSSKSFDENVGNMIFTEQIGSLYNQYFNETLTEPFLLSFAESLYNKSQINGSLERLQPRECMEIYDQTFLSDRSNIILVVYETEYPLGPTEPFSNGSILWYFDSRSYQISYSFGNWRLVCGRQGRYMHAQQ